MLLLQRYNIGHSISSTALDIQGVANLMVNISPTGVPLIRSSLLHIHQRPKLTFLVMTCRN